jgi:hypothetical protein
MLRSGPLDRVSKHGASPPDRVGGRLFETTAFRGLLRVRVEDLRAKAAR